MSQTTYHVPLTHPPHITVSLRNVRIKLSLNTVPLILVKWLLIGNPNTQKVCTSFLSISERCSNRESDMHSIPELACYNFKLTFSNVICLHIVSMATNQRTCTPTATSTALCQLTDKSPTRPHMQSYTYIHTVTQAIYNNYVFSKYLPPCFILNIRRVSSIKGVSQVLGPQSHGLFFITIAHWL